MEIDYSEDLSLEKIEKTNEIRLNEIELIFIFLRLIFSIHQARLEVH